jgi:hypothetical protein
MARLAKSHPLRIFFVSGVISIGALLAVGVGLGPSALMTAVVLVLIEITFSFENAIINAKVLSSVSKFWRQLFITLGVLIAVVGMRLLFPLLVVSITAQLPFTGVIDIALNHPAQYAKALGAAHISIAAFGGMFLLMLSLSFFLDRHRRVRWIDIIERPLQDMSRWWTYTLACVLALIGISLLVDNTTAFEVFVAGGSGIVLYLLIHGFAELFSRQQRKVPGRALKSGVAGLTAFIYLEVLDASFSFDGVIGAFAVTSDVVLITLGLGIGALWVRSLTIFMVERRVLKEYRYLEHGAHYTIFILAIILLSGIFIEIPQFIAGIIGIVIVSLSVVSSLKYARLQRA